MTESMVERVRDALRAECLKVYGTNWNNDVAEEFARAAIAALRPKQFGDLPIEVALAGEAALEASEFPTMTAVHACLAAVIDACLAEHQP
jgi:hypothetical protein